MTENTSNKKRIFYIIVLILTLITMAVGMALSYFSYVGSQKEDSTVIYTGTLQINYIDGVYFKDPSLRPTSKVDFNTTERVYRNSFQVKSTGTLDQTIDVSYVITKNEFYQGELKYVLYNSDGKKLTNGTVPESGKVNLIKNTFLAHNSTITYTLIIWWQDGDYKLKTEMGSVVSGRIEIDAKQVRY